MADEARKAELAAEIALSRRQFSKSLGKIREDLNVSHHIKQNFRKNKAAWLGGATALGWVLSRLPARRRKIETRETGGKKIREIEKTGLLLGVAKLLFSAARPALTALAKKKIASLAARREHGS